MSILHYPLGLISELDVTPQDRTLIDEFEAGSTAARSYWPANSFKRIFQITHAPLKPAEWEYLKKFYAARSGQFDTFWYRDNIGRNGNALVRFSQALAHEHHSQIVTLAKQYVNLAEVAPIRALPEIEEVTAAAGYVPLLWWDANREFYLTHCGQVILDPVTAGWDMTGNFRPVWKTGTVVNLGSSIGAQHQFYHFIGAEFGLAASAPAMTGTKPPVTIFLFARHSATATKQILFSIGTLAQSNAIGVQLGADNKYKPWVGASETYTNAMSANPGDAWQSIAVVYANASDNESLYVNAALVGTDSVTRYRQAGAPVMGAAWDGTLIANPGGAMTNCDLANVLLFYGALTAAQIKAVHNLLAYQFGLATVA